MEPGYPALAVAACEVVDAMTHGRGYRGALAVKAALAEIEKWAPPEVVEAVRRAIGIIRQDGRAGKRMWKRC